jgi:hypothetical protein
MRGTASAAHEAVGAESGVAKSGSECSQVSSLTGAVARRVDLFLEEGAGGASEVVVVVPNAGADVSRVCAALHGCRERNEDDGWARRGHTEGA